MRLTEKKGLELPLSAQTQNIIMIYSSATSNARRIISSKLLCRSSGVKLLAASPPMISEMVHIQSASLPALAATA